MKKLHLILTVLLLYSSFSFAEIHYVSNNGSSTGDGSLTNPFDKISTAYNAAVSNGQNEVIKLMPGIYYETNTLVFTNENITISGYGDGSVIEDNIIVKSDMSFADLYIQGSFSNEAFAVFDNVKCDDSNINVEKISGAWRDSADTTHINSLIDPQDGFEAVNLDSMNTYVQGSLTTFVDESELVNEVWVKNHVSNYVSENALLIKDGVVDLSGNIISNFSEIFLRNDNCIASGVVHSTMGPYFDTHISYKPPAGVILQYVKFTSGSWNGMIFELSSIHGTPSWCGPGYYYYKLNTNSYSIYIPIGTEFQIFGNDITISEKFVDQAGDTMAGPLLVNKIEMYSTTNQGYLVAGCSYENANGIYQLAPNYYNDSAPVYQNANNIFMFRYLWIEDGNISHHYWTFSDTLVNNISQPFPTPCYDYSTSSSSTPPEEWNQSTVIGPTHPQAPVIDFAGGKGINLATCTTTNDIANKGYVDDCFKGFDYDARYVYIDKYYDGRNGYKGTLQAPYTNFYHAYNKLGQNSFYGISQPVIYHVGNGFYSIPSVTLTEPNRYVRVGIEGQGSYYRNIHQDLNGNNSTVFSELGTYINEFYCHLYNGNTILHLKDLVISNVNIYSSAHDEIYCDNVIFLNITNNGQQVYHGLYYKGQLNVNNHYEALISSSIRPAYYYTIQQSNNASYVSKSGDTMTGTLTVPHLNVSESGDWLIGSANQIGNIVLQNQNSAITTPSGSGNDINLSPDGSGNVVVNSNFDVDGKLFLKAFYGEGGEMEFAAHGSNPKAILDVQSQYLRLLSIDSQGNIRQVAVWDLYSGPIVGTATMQNGQYVLPANIPISQ
ncbi:MAG: hypothetical protein DRH37_02875 [Deltaproteobacteria bacterium]|nr:MAG: hypothetical protein DRH37_02875 [Deltaproteobacteria bacterium]